MYINKGIIAIFFLIAVGRINSVAQIWPIDQSDDTNYWNRISGTFGEIHPTNGDHFHGAIDIDTDVLNCPVRAVENGRVREAGTIATGLEHVYPAGTSNYNRRTRYLHVIREAGISIGSVVNQGDKIAKVEASTATTSNHLHFEMWEFENGNWYKLNPLANEQGWQLNSPTDTSEPQINNVFLEPVTQPNNVASGFTIYKNSGALTNQATNVKIHFLNRPGSTGNIFNYDNDRLVVYGNIIPTVGVRDVSINSTASSGNGLTIHKLNYSINNALKYQIYFDRVTTAEDNSIGEIFHTEFNNGDSRLYGNDDYIELYTINNNYLSVDKRLNSLISNGVWFTKAKTGEGTVFSTTPTAAANHSGEALYSDGPHSMTFRAEDAVGLFNEAQLKVIVDNFKPYIKEVIVRKNSANGNLVYRGYWEWSTSSSRLELIQQNINDAGPTDNVWIKIVASEPIENLRINIPSVDGQTYWDIDSSVPNTNNTEFEYLYNSINSAATNIINLQAQDLAGNALQTNPSLIPVRAGNGTWGTGASPGVDSNHHFNTGSSVCSSGTGGRKASEAMRTSALSCLYVDFSADKITPAINEMVTFSPITSGNGVLTYNWNFGNDAVPSSSTSAGPQKVIYTTSGQKNVTLKLCDGSGNCITETKSSIVNVGAPPSQLKVDFTADRFGGNVGDNIRLTSTVTGAVGTVSYAWNFGEGVSLGQFSDVNPLIAYSTPGNKTIQLTVTDANGSVATVKNNYILITSLAFNVGVTITGCGPTTSSGMATFSKIVTGGNGEPYDTYLWDFGDGTTSTSSESTVSHTYKKYGKYTVRLRVCDETGCGVAESVNCVDVPTSVESSTLAASFLINDLPVLGPIQEVGLNTPVKFTSSTTGGGDANTFKYSWKFDYNIYNASNGTSASPNTGYTSGPKAQEVFYKTTGNKSVILSVDNGSIARGTPFQEVLKVVAGRGSGTCMATIGNVTISSTCWSASAKPKFTVPVSTTNCPIAKTEVLHWVNSGTAYVLPNGVLDFSNYSPGDIPSFPFTADFSFAVYQYDGVNYNRIGYKRQRFTIYGPVVANAGPDKQACYGASVPIGPSLPENKIYKWSSTTSPLNLLSNTDIPNPTVNALQKGTLKYRVTVTDQTSGCATSDEVVLTVNKPEVQSNTFLVKLGVPSPLSVTVTEGFGNNTYQWSPADKLSNVSIPTPSFTSTSEGDFNYIVTVTDQRGCIGLSQVFVNASSAPGNLIAKAESYSRISLVWIDRSPNETSFVIQRSVDGGSFTDYATVAANIVNFDDINVVKSSSYTYRVAAKIGASISGFTNEASSSTGTLTQFSLASENLNAVGDFDNDRDMDYVKLTSTTAEIYINNSGSFVLTQSLSLPTPPTTASIQSFRTIVGDFDNDSDNDIYIIPYSQGRYTVMILKNSNGIFSVTADNLNAQTITIPNFYPFDYGNDNDIDFLIDLLYPTGSATFFINENSGTASFTTQTTQLPTAYSLSNGGFMDDFPGTSFGLSDIDNDGDEDIVVPNTGNTLNSFINNGGFQQSNSNLVYTGCCNGEGTIEFGDFNSDRRKDIVHISPVATVLLKNTGSFPFENTNLIIPKFIKGVSKFGDYDSDGDLDLFVSGNTTATATQHSIYENNAGSFTLRHSVDGQLVDWIDFDSDGDLDLIGFGGKLYKNNNGQSKPRVNAVPSAPTNLCMYYSGDNEVTFSWRASSDVETPSAGLTYNLFVKQNGAFLMSPLSDLATGFRKIQKRGNVDQNTSWTLKLVGGGNMEWGVQAVDNAFMGSSFSTSSFTIQSFCGDIVSPVFLSKPEIILPYNCSSNTVTVKNGASLKLQAPGNIKLLPGFTVQLGGAFNAKNGQYSPTQAPCADGTSGRLSAEVNNEGREDGIYLNISPNPTNGPLDLEVDFGRVEDNIVVEVININGVSILRNEYGRRQYIKDQIDISGSNSGLYLVKIFSGNQVLFRKIIKV